MGGAGWNSLARLCHCTLPGLYGYQKVEPATTKLYLCEIAGGFEECDLVKQGTESLMELNP